jgi:hypothetical protein
MQAAVRPRNLTKWSPHYPTRRFLLDLLFAREGRTLTELESELAMTRFGVMKQAAGRTSSATGSPSWRRARR